ncbi:NME NM23 member 5 [Rhizoclosmatium sp. JEL0117]|nr:NME NM23 member 5 [Rhizoclosmatium sp. JEL0117]
MDFSSFNDAVTEQTVFLIRPEALHCENHIVHALKQDGFKILDRKHLAISPEQAQAQFTATAVDPNDLDALDGYVGNLTGAAGSAVVLLLSRFNALDSIKSLMGPLDLLEAKDFAPTSLRAKFAVSSQKCAVEATETFEATEASLRIFFPDRLRTTLPSVEESKMLLEEALYPVLTQGLTMLCKEKPANPTVWLGKWLVDHNPNRPNVADV